VQAAFTARRQKTDTPSASVAAITHRAIRPCPGSHSLVPHSRHTTPRIEYMFDIVGKTMAIRPRPMTPLDGTASDSCNHHPRPPTGEALTSTNTAFDAEAGCVGRSSIPGPSHQPSVGRRSVTARSNRGIS
jgi:hypothetical protein